MNSPGWSAWLEPGAEETDSRIVNVFFLLISFHLISSQFAMRFSLSATGFNLGYKKVTWFEFTHFFRIYGLAVWLHTLQVYK